MSEQRLPVFHARQQPSSSLSLSLVHLQTRTDIWVLYEGHGMQILLFLDSGQARQAAKAAVTIFNNEGRKT